MKKFKFDRIKESLNGNLEFIPIVEAPISLLVLPNHNLVCSTIRSIILFNDKLQEIKNISTKGKSFCALNRRNGIYVSVREKISFLLFDLNLNQLKQFGSCGSCGSGNNQLNYPYGLSCHDDYLYICDCGNKRIQILTLDFEYTSSIQLEGFYPFRVLVSKSTIGVCCYEGIFFYDLKTTTLK